MHWTAGPIRDRPHPRASPGGEFRKTVDRVIARIVAETHGVAHAAEHLWGLTRTRQPPPPEVTARTERRIKGVRTRRCRKLDERDTTEHHGIPVTTVARTLVDQFRRYTHADVCEGPAPDAR